MRKHIVCATCGILCNCDWMEFGIDADDMCKKTDNDFHTPLEVDCKCRSITSKTTMDYISFIVPSENEKK